MRTRAQLALVGLVGAIALAGCGGSGSSAAAADGWTRVTVGQLSVERPSDWAQEPAGGDLWTERFVGDGVELQIAGKLSEDPTASAAVSRLDLPAMGGLDDYEGGGVRSIEVKGADTAVRSDFTFTVDGQSRMGVWLIAGQWPYPRTAAVALSGATLDEKLVAHIIDSMSFDKRLSAETGTS